MLSLDAHIEQRETKRDTEAPKLLNFETTIEIDATPTSLVCIEYSNKLFISVSTSGNFSSLLLVKSEGELEPGATQSSSSGIYDVRTIFGQEEPLLQIFARHLAEKLRIQHDITKPLLLSIGVLKDQLNNQTLFKQIEATLLQLYQVPPSNV